MFQIRSTILLYWNCWYWERFRFTTWCSLICVEDKISNDEEALMVLQTRGNPSQRCLSARNMKLVESCNGRMPVYINSLKLFVSFSLSSCWSFWDLIVLFGACSFWAFNDMFLPLSWKAPCYFLKKKHLGTWMIATWPCLSLDPHPSELFKSKKHADFCFSISVASLHMDFLHVSGLSKKNSIPPLKKTTKNTIPHQTSTHAMLNHLNLFWIDYPPYV